MAERIVVVGGGFGGLELVKGLAGSGSKITLVDKKNHHLFQPLLYQVATAGLSPANIAWPIRSIFRKRKDVDTVLGEVTAVDWVRKSVRLANGDEIPYDKLVLATGMTNGWFGHDEWARHATGLKELTEATTIRNEILTAYEEADRTDDEAERKALMTFVVIGGGPTGVELAGSIAELVRRIMPDDFRNLDPKEARIVLIEAGDRLLSTFDSELSRRARVDLERFGVEVWTRHPVTELTGDSVKTSTQKIATRHVFWAAGVKGTPVANWLGVEPDRAGRVPVDGHCQVADRDGVFVIGDVARFEQDGKVLPGVASVAIQQGKFLARKFMGRETRAFRYKDPGSMATIGRKSAVVELGELKLGGFLAWLMWLFVHLMNLMGFQNKALVFVQWVWAYVSYQRGARLILGSGRLESFKKE